jgi:hypothetical protein
MAAKFAIKYRKPIASTSLGVKDSSTTLATDAEYATISCGQGVPTSSEPNGSLFLRRDASDADTVLYARIGGAWVALVGAS